MSDTLAENRQFNDDQLDPALIRRLQQIIRDVLGIEPMAPDDALPDLVNRSIMILNLVVAVKDDLGAEIPIEIFFDHTTLRGLASFIARSLAGQET
jgi:acyl carrier protein